MPRKKKKKETKETKEGFSLLNIFINDFGEITFNPSTAIFCDEEKARRARYEEKARKARYEEKARKARYGENKVIHPTIV